MSWTCFSPGIFLDYYSPATPGSNGKGKLASSETLWPAGFTFIVDFDEKVAEIPGDGGTGLIALTAADDIGGFLAAACTQLPLSEWPCGEWGICGGLYTPNEIVAIATKVRGMLFEMLLSLGPLETEYISREGLCKLFEIEDKGDVARLFHWQVLLAVLEDELRVDHNASGVEFKFQDLEMFVREWW
jgi:hypothetical protein